MIYYVVYMFQNKVPVARIIATSHTLTDHDIRRQYPSATTAIMKKTIDEAIDLLQRDGFKQKYNMDTTYFVIV